MSRSKSGKRSGRERRRRKALKRRESRLTRGGRGPDIPFLKPPDGLKMSKVLLDFAEPLLPQGETGEEWYKTLCLAAAAWNAALLPGREGQDAIDDIVEEMGPGVDEPDKEAIKAALHMMVARKKHCFPGCKRAIIDFEVRETDRGYDVDVVSTL